MKKLVTLALIGVLFAFAPWAQAADMFSPGFKFQDPTDPTKTVTFDLSAVPHGSALVLAVPSTGGTIALAGGTPLASFTGQTVARVYTLRDASTIIVTRSASLTAGRIVQTDSNGELFDTANLAFSDSAGKLTVTGTSNPAACFHTSLTGYCVVGGASNSLRVMNEAGTAWLPFSALSLRVASTGQVTFSNSSNPETTVDTGLVRAAPGVVRATNGATAGGWVQNGAGVTGNAGDWTNVTATLANLNGLTRDLLAGRSYTFRMLLYTSDPDATEGVQLDFGGGTATATNFRAHCVAYDSTSTLQFSAQVASLSSLVTAGTVTGASLVECNGSIEPATAGTFIPRAAQNVHNAGTLTIARGSHLLLEDVPFQVAYGLQLLAIGDSKTLGETCCNGINGYRNTLVTNLTATGNWPSVGFTGALGQSGGTTATVNGLVPAFLASQTLQPQWALVNLGSNDVPKIHDGTLTSSAWLASMGTLLDAIHARWPSTQVRLMRVYHTTYPTECDTIAGWMDTVVASRSAWAAVGPDERVFLPGHVSDVTHPDSTGYGLTASAWQTVMGY